MAFSPREEEDLLPLHRNHYQILQRKDGFRFGLDAVLLADFCRAGKRDRVCDLGTGSGIIPLLIAANTTCEQITGVEILPQYADMAARSVEGNELSHRIRILEGDYRSSSLLPTGGFTLVVSNPPYQQLGGGVVSPSSERALACIEYNATLADVAITASRLLSDGGRFCMVYRPERLGEAISLLSSLSLPVKKLRFAMRTIESEPSLVLIESRKGAAEGMRIAPPLLLCGNTKTGESEELISIYRRTKHSTKENEHEN